MNKIILIAIISLLSTASISSEWYFGQNVSPEFKLGLSEKINQLDPAKRKTFRNKLKSLSKKERQNLMNEFRECCFEYWSQHRENKKAAASINNKFRSSSQGWKNATMKNYPVASESKKDAFRKKNKKKKNSMSQSQKETARKKMGAMSQSQRNSISNKRSSMNPSQKDAFKKKMRSMSPLKKKALRKKMRGSMK